MDIEAAIETYRSDITAHCYRMLGSVHDAEDLTQETMLRAWRARARYDADRASIRTWLYRIATNACLTALEGQARRPLPSGMSVASEDPGAALTPALDVAWLQPYPDHRHETERRTDLRLAFVAALQFLSARQRAVLLLRDVLQFSAAEVADQLDSTVASVNSALQRARATLADRSQIDTVTEPDDPTVRTTIARYIESFEAADVAALVTLLAEDAVLEMPPVPLWYRGREHYGAFMARVFQMRGPGWRVRALTANGQPALAAFAPGPDGELLRHSLQMLSITLAADAVDHRGAGEPQRGLRRPGRAVALRRARAIPRSGLAQLR